MSAISARAAPPPIPTPAWSTRQYLCDRGPGHHRANRRALRPSPRPRDRFRFRHRPCPACRRLRLCQCRDQFRRQRAGGAGRSQRSACSSPTPPARCRLPPSMSPPTARWAWRSPRPISTASLRWCRPTAPTCPAPIWGCSSAPIFPPASPPPATTNPTAQTITLIRGAGHHRHDPGRPECPAGPEHALPVRDPDRKRHHAVDRHQ